jgi:uncharacterized membrane protein affecting hemolysin expression
LLRELSSVEGIETGTVKSQIELEMRLHSAEESLDRTEKLLAEKNDENKRLNEDINQLTSNSLLLDPEAYQYETAVKCFANLSHVLLRSTRDSGG